jgi:hypothetical protein
LGHFRGRKPAVSVEQRMISTSRRNSRHDRVSPAFGPGESKIHHGDTEDTEVRVRGSPRSGNNASMLPVRKPTLTAASPQLDTSMSSVSPW